MDIFKGSGFRLKVWGFGVQGFAFKVQDLRSRGLKVQVLGSGAAGLGLSQA